MEADGRHVEAECVGQLVCGPRVLAEELEDPAADAGAEFGGVHHVTVSSERPGQTGSKGP